ncbi:hydroxymethylbilane synthase [Psychrobacillus psychrotolerans]|uniref:Porphobilinogen deaminase n=1 Tax=Psychrobacillus psychrotolerans TaxID=126156 RepID=A0A1I5YU57_9BACI|nr:hydroxymethylbilane synthase [Psychrobacillus psychrotolerans]SFQ47712.1 hydroxymethylbilane synthase [Psychrobacillus psychrotolerans]
MRKIIVGSRRSKLALTQTNWFIQQMKDMGAPFEFEVKEIVTKGDQILNVTLSKVGGKGLFVKEIEQALYDKEIDFAVHSMKDMPSELPEGLVMGCIPKRVDERDAFISTGHVKFADLPTGAVVGTSSLRRSAQLLLLRPDIEIKWIRGNVETRLKKLQDGEYDAIILAAAGLKRLGWSDEVVTEYLTTEDCIPAVGQGALGIECRADDQELIDELGKLSDHDTWVAIEAERAFLSAMDGGCQVPIAGHATISDGKITMTGLIAAPDASVVFKEVLTGMDAARLGKELASIMTEQGAYDLIQQVKADLNV